ncbi:MAG: hypothetical protein ACLP52_16130 [Streptosporangiaceae bacterium]
MTELIRHCPDCGCDQLFELCHPQPGGCPDAPDAQCPEWACTACGAALLIGVLLAEAADPELVVAHGRVA